ncbi:MAG: tRNA lysidine(34) synthetase TilS [Clostridiales bacterium]|nr:tRNA lysidine(34) synthetase TilS [Clostridiales bacterium]
MKPELTALRDKKICVAVSGGRDSMALLHLLNACSEEYAITLCALNCEHGLRGEASKRDSLFVKSICEKWGIPLLTFSEDCRKLSKDRGVGEEVAARDWRRSCYALAAEHFGKDNLGSFAIATAHHANDNAETVLFNIARGSGLAGASGICDGEIDLPSSPSVKVKIVRPLISCTRDEIDAYIFSNNIPFVEDETNLSTQFTRNYIRINVIPSLEKCVSGAVNGIYRFSRLVRDDEEYFDKLIEEKQLIKNTPFGVEIALCDEKVIFRRAALKAIKLLNCQIKDYTSEHMQALFDLQNSERGKRFEFCGLVAFNEGNRIGICLKEQLTPVDGSVLLKDYINDEKSIFYGVNLSVKKQLGREYAANNGILCKNGRVLNLDYSLIPDNAEIRFRRPDDRFRKFGSGEKSLNDFFTDKKISVRLRDRIPVLACGNNVLAVCGVEISDGVKISGNTQEILCVCGYDFSSKN